MMLDFFFLSFLSLVYPFTHMHVHYHKLLRHSQIVVLVDLVDDCHCSRQSKGSQAIASLVSSFIAICNHRLYPVDISAKASQLHLLTLARFDRQWICVNPLVGGHVCGVMCICKDIEDSW